MHGSSHSVIMGPTPPSFQGWQPLWYICCEVDKNGLGFLSDFDKWWSLHASNWNVVNLFRWTRKKQEQLEKMIILSIFLDLLFSALFFFLSLVLSVSDTKWEGGGKLGTRERECRREGGAGWARSIASLNVRDDDVKPLKTTINYKCFETQRFEVSADAVGPKDHRFKVKFYSL